jgi:hypothetical protein
MNARTPLFLAVICFYPAHAAVAQPKQPNISNIPDPAAGYRALSHLTRRSPGSWREELSVTDQQREQLDTLDAKVESTKNVLIPSCGKESLKRITL